MARTLSTGAASQPPAQPASASAAPPARAAAISAPVSQATSAARAPALTRVEAAAGAGARDREARAALLGLMQQHGLSVADVLRLAASLLEDAEKV